MMHLHPEFSNITFFSRIIFLLRRFDIYNIKLTNIIEIGFRIALFYTKSGNFVPCLPASAVWCGRDGSRSYIILSHGTENYCPFSLAVYI